MSSSKHLILNPQILKQIYLSIIYSWGIVTIHIVWTIVSSIPGDSGVEQKTIAELRC